MQIHNKQPIDPSIPDTQHTSPQPINSATDPYLQNQTNETHAYQAPLREAPSLEDRQNEFHKRESIKRVKGVGSILAFITSAYLLALFVSSFAFHTYQVIGESMSPTLHEGNWLIVNKLGKQVSSLTGNDFVPKRGDVILFEDPRSGQEKTLIKRVIALPGEQVALENGSLIVYNDEFPNGFDPDTDYKDTLHQPTQADSLFNGPLTVPQGEIFVSGDNRIPGRSEDSRGRLGTVPFDNIIGSLSLRIFPLSDFDTSF